MYVYYVYNVYIVYVLRLGIVRTRVLFAIAPLNVNFFQLFPALSSPISANSQPTNSYRALSGLYQLPLFYCEGKFPYKISQGKLWAAKFPYNAGGKSYIFAVLSGSLGG